MTPQTLAARAYAKTAAPLSTQRVKIQSAELLTPSDLLDASEKALRAAIDAQRKINARFAPDADATYQKALARFVPLRLDFLPNLHARVASRTQPGVVYHVSPNACNCPAFCARRCCTHNEAYCFVRSSPAPVPDARLVWAYQIPCECGRGGKEVCAAWVMRFEVDGRGDVRVEDCAFCGRRVVGC